MARRPISGSWQTTSSGKLKHRDSQGDVEAARNQRECGIVVRNAGISEVISFVNLLVGRGEVAGGAGQRRAGYLGAIHAEQPL